MHGSQCVQTEKQQCLERHLQHPENLEQCPESKCGRLHKKVNFIHAELAYMNKTKVTWIWIDMDSCDTRLGNLNQQAERNGKNRH